MTWSFFLCVPFLPSPSLSSRCLCTASTVQISCVSCNPAPKKIFFEQAFDPRKTVSQKLGGEKKKKKTFFRLVQRSSMPYMVLPVCLRFFFFYLVCYYRLNLSVCSSVRGYGRYFLCVFVPFLFGILHCLSLQGKTFVCITLLLAGILLV